MTLPIASSVGFSDALFYGIPILLALVALGLIAASVKNSVIAFLVGVIICFSWMVALRVLAERYGDKAWALFYLLVSAIFLTKITRGVAPNIVGRFRIGGGKKEAAPNNLLTFTAISVEFIAALVIWIALPLLWS